MNAGGGALPIGTGLQFANNGFVVKGDGLELIQAATEIRVGNGTAKASTFSEAQIAFVLKQAEDGATIGEGCRRAGISDGTFYN